MAGPLIAEEEDRLVEPADPNVLRRLDLEGDAAAVVTEVPALTIPEGTNVIVYAIGDLAGDSFQLAVQSIGGLHTPPVGVPSGTGGELTNGVPAWLLASFAVAGAAFAFGGVQVSRQRG